MLRRERPASDGVGVAHAAVQRRVPDWRNTPTRVARVAQMARVARPGAIKACWVEEDVSLSFSVTYTYSHTLVRKFCSTRTCRADGREGSVRVGGAAAAAVCHLQDVADDGLFVHRGPRRHRGR